MKRYDAYLFDADGTLLDSREIIHRSFNHAIESMGAPHPGYDFIDQTIGLPLTKQMRLVVGEGRDESYYEEAGRIYGEHMTTRFHDCLALFPGAKDCLAALRANGAKLAVVTSRRRYSLEQFLGHLGLLDCFDLLVTPEDTPRHKPDPDPALFAARALDVPPERCVFIGDALFDIQCGGGAGMDTVLVRWGMNPEGWPVQPTAIIDSFAELLPAP